MSGRIFVSSTCYDLLDLRAEVETHIRELGLVPVLSDRPTSDFQVVPNNSIATCLANVQGCDEFLCIVSQRYGALLGGAGFANISATHLEYREAQTLHKPIRFFVRDRAAGDYSNWKTNGRGPNFKGAWVKDTGVYEFLEEHQNLSQTNISNWYWPFSSSVDLRARLTVELGAVSRRATLRSLIQSNRLPTLHVEVRRLTGSLSTGLSGEVWVTALDRPVLGGRLVSPFSGTNSNLAVDRPALLGKSTFGVSTNLSASWPLVLEYISEAGHRIRDTYTLTYDSSKNTHRETVVLAARELMGDGYELL
jgi:Domain of unknown function (DUF4062)